MRWWKGLLGLDRDGAAIEKKEIIGSGALGVLASGGVSRQDGDNFRTNRVTLAQYQDGIAGSGNPLGLAATWACVNLIAGTIATLPLMVYRTVDGVRTVARDHPLFYVLHDSPNMFQSPVDFMEFTAAGVELQGNGYATIARDSAGAVRGLTPVRPDIVTVRRKGPLLLEYEWAEDGQRVVKTSGEMLHIRGPMASALGGVSTLAICRGAFAGATSAEGAARSTFANGLRPSGTLSVDTVLSSEQRAELETLLQDKFAGAINAGRPMLLDNGLKWNALNITPEDAQMLESRKFSGEEICRIFGVPPAMAGYGDKSSNWGTGKEVDVLGFIKFALRRRCARIEQAMTKQLLTAADHAQGVTIEFNMEGLLRGDSAARAAFYKDALGDTQRPGWMVRNEVRRLENRPPIPGWDEPIELVQQGAGVAPPAREEE